APPPRCLPGSCGFRGSPGARRGRRDGGGPSGSTGLADSRTSRACGRAGRRAPESARGRFRAGAPRARRGRGSEPPASQPRLTSVSNSVRCLERGGTMGRELINPPDLHPAPGFSHIAVAGGRRLVFVAGQVALDREFNVVGGDDLGAQTRAAMENVGRALEAVGAGWDDIVRRTVYTKQPTEYEVIAQAM